MKILRLWPGWIFVVQATQSVQSHELITPLAYDENVDRGDFGSYPVRTSITTKDKAPKANYLDWSPSCDDGMYTFITPKGWKVADPGPMILDAYGELVWSEHYGNEYGGQAYNLQVQNYQGEDHLTFWSGDDRIVGHGFGHFYMLNSSYDIVRKVGAADGNPADLHEFRITSEGTALVVIYQIIVGDLTPLGQKLRDWLFSTQYVWDSIIQEIDIDTGNLVFEWRASEHVNITSTYREMGEMGTQSDPFDWFHVNSVEKDEYGNYLISVRYTHAIYYINGKTKEIIWSLGGKTNHFMDLSGGHALNFAWQHDARFHPTSSFPETYKSSNAPAGMMTVLMTVFDNSGEDWNYAYGPPFSRGMVLELTYPHPGSSQTCDSMIFQDPAVRRHDIPNRQLSPKDLEKISSINRTDSACTAQLIHEYVNPQHVRSSSQGSLQLIPTGPGRDPKVLIGFGLCAVVTEFASHGPVQCNMHFGANTSWETGDVQSYRASKHRWTGQPRTQPAVAIKSDVVFVSWNGATEVRTWRMQVSDAAGPDQWTDGALLAKAGFETAIAIPPEHHAARYIRVLGLDVDGKILPNGVSRSIDRGRVDALLRQHLGSHRAGLAKMMFAVLSYLAAFLVVYALYRICRRSRRKRGSHNGVLGTGSKRA